MYQEELFVYLVKIFYLQIKDQTPSLKISYAEFNVDNGLFENFFQFLEKIHQNVSLFKHRARSVRNKKRIYQRIKTVVSNTLTHYL